MYGWEQNSRGAPRDSPKTYCISNFHAARILIAAPYFRVAEGLAVLKWHGRDSSAKTLPANLDLASFSSFTFKEFLPKCRTKKEKS